MAYITLQELSLRYPTLKSWQDEDSEVNSGLISYAENELNGLLATHFSVPFSDAHPTVKDLTMDLSYYRVMVTKDPDKAEKFRKRVHERIDRIKNGEEMIYTGSGTIIEVSDSSLEVWSTTKDYHPTFSMLDEASAYSRVDSSRLQSEASERS